MNDFSTSLRTKRLDMEMTLRNCAIISGLSPSRISELERCCTEQPPTADERASLAKTIDLADLLDSKYTPNPQEVADEIQWGLDMKNLSPGEFLRKYAAFHCSL